MNLLLVEDNRKIADVIFDYFELKGIALDYACNGQQGFELACQNFYDLIILDVMLPKMDGFTVCQQLRREGVETPVLMLTARDTREDMLNGFSQGADDYLVKPFDLDILEARVNALVRRQRGDTATKNLTFADLSLNLEQHNACREGKTFPLNQAQFTLLRLLIKRAPGVVSKKELCSALWGDNEPEGDVLRNHIYQLRTLIDKPFDQAYIKTVAKVGYQLVDK